MKPIQEVLKTKELELQQLQHEIDVLRQAFRLLQDDADTPISGVTVHPGISKGNPPLNTAENNPLESFSNPNDKAGRQFP